MVLLPKIQDARFAIVKNNGSELAAKQSSDLDNIAQDIQFLLAEIHTTKINALKEIDEQYKERLEELDSSYAMILSLMSNHKPVDEEDDE
jgi:hypothetical protein